MSSDAFSPITTSRTLETPKGHRIYTTTRDVASEYPLPAIGSLLSETNFIAGFSGHYVLDVNDSPKGNGKRVTVTHGSFPGGLFTEYESLAFTFPPIYPVSGSSFFPGGSRPRGRVVPARVTYEYALTPGSWLSSPAIWDFSSPSTGPFEVRSFIAEAAGQNFTEDDGASGSVGDFLNPAFIMMDTVNNPITIHSPGSLFYVVPASVPNATTYASWVASGTELMASRTIHKWYCGYMRRSAYVRAQ
jgi:hypothetical protein